MTDPCPQARARLKAKLEQRLRALAREQSDYVARWWRMIQQREGWPSETHARIFSGKQPDVSGFSQRSEQLRGVISDTPTLSCEQVNGLLRHFESSGGPGDRASKIGAEPPRMPGMNAPPVIPPPVQGRASHVSTGANGPPEIALPNGHTSPTQAIPGASSSSAGGPGPPPIDLSDYDQVDAQGYAIDSISGDSLYLEPVEGQGSHSKEAGHAVAPPESLDEAEAETEQFMEERFPWLAEGVEEDEATDSSASRRPPSSSERDGEQIQPGSSGRRPRPKPASKMDPHSQKVPEPERPVEPDGSYGRLVDYSKDFEKYYANERKQRPSTKDDWRRGYSQEELKQGEYALWKAVHSSDLLDEEKILAEQHEYEKTHSFSGPEANTAREEYRTRMREYRQRLYDRRLQDCYGQPGHRVTYAEDDSSYMQAYPDGTIYTFEKANSAGGSVTTYERFEYPDGSQASRIRTSLPSGSGGETSGYSAEQTVIEKDPITHVARSDSSIGTGRGAAPVQPDSQPESSQSPEYGKVREDLQRTRRHGFWKDKE